MAALEARKPRVRISHRSFRLTSRKLRERNSSKWSNSRRTFHPLAGLCGS